MGRVSVWDPIRILGRSFSYKTNLIWLLLVQYWIRPDFYLVRGNLLVYAIALMVNALTYNFDSDQYSFLFDSAVEQVKRIVIFRFLRFLSGVGRHPELSTVVAGFLFTEHWFGPIYCYYSFSFPFFWSLWWRSQRSDERNYLTLKWILE